MRLAQRVHFAQLETTGNKYHCTVPIGICYISIGYLGMFFLVLCGGEIHLLHYIATVIENFLDCTFKDRICACFFIFFTLVFEFVRAYCS